MALRKLDSHVKKNDTSIWHDTIHENSKLVKNLNLRLEIIKLLVENIVGKLLDTGLGSEFLDLILKAKAENVKINRSTSN